MHTPDAEMTRLAKAAFEYAFERIHMDPPPLDGPRPYADVFAEVGQTVTPDGLGPQRALQLYTEVLAPTCISVDHPAHLSFVPGAPNEASIIFDMVVSSSGIYGGSWLEACGAVYAENQTLRWISDLAGLPASAGGTFVSGGTAGNLSALIAARHRWRRRAKGRHDRTRALILASQGAHSSVVQAALAMDVDVVDVPADARGRLTASALQGVVDVLPTSDRDRLCAIVATAGTTNIGVVDDLRGVGEIAASLGTWFHVDGAYGGAALCAPSVRHLFDGIELADSLIVDPHKWLFAPYDSCALVYRNVHDGRRAHRQHAEYLEVLYDDVHDDEHDGDHDDDHDGEHDGGRSGPTAWLESNPSDLAHHLSRRVRGLPLWFGLAVHGTKAYSEAVETTMQVTRDAAQEIRRRPYLNLLVEPDLSILVVERVGWTEEQVHAWSDAQLAAGRAFVLPSTYQGKPILRMCIVNPRTTMEIMNMVFDSLATEPGATA